MEMERKILREGPMQETGSSVKEAFTRLRADVKNIGNQLVNATRDKAKAGVDSVDEFAHNKPYITSAITLGVGVLLGGIVFGWLLRSRAKDKD